MGNKQSAEAVDLLSQLGNQAVAKHAQKKAAKANGLFPETEALNEVNASFVPRPSSPKKHAATVAAQGVKLGHH